MKKKFKLTYNAPVILTFVILCFIATILGIVTNNRSTEALFSAYRGSFSNPLTYVRLIGHIFGHVGLEHFVGNAMLLLLLGPMLEEKYGSTSLIKVIVITALFTGIIHCLLWNNMALCGASGIVFACIILSSFTAFKDGEVPLTFVLVSVMYIGKEVYSGILIQDGVSNLTHILGGVVGGVSGFLLNRR